ncbi:MULTISPECIES: pilus assembly protein CpaE [Sphingobium]|uniref:Response regulatory domain-containing protein n=2 Tax=Sphingobium fuliginis (strain ATCC 27551) TaxID=336203 RepID=A0ABQ1ER81_SPHSA|nr:MULTISPECIES: pilus assembly protein CpaE [Sphingobium]AJR24798.1 pilus assembly protein CpaE [Sphingobium sp. YBL2]MCB4859226.1 pilus assembly protein CpaE [Sphingobium sp. PNB]QDC36086.1 pilus assembly protein CpaE [Sphingobium fuliginis ATCC 27551]RYL99290.1 pilus assembly protein CpaE [Sphingobium fuliginis]UXC91153.1 pilus assembly protein CpaE [Sphingobium sp. RSMS]
MNAPWKPGASGQRDPFHAFVCDDHSFDLLRVVAAEMGWAPEKVNKGGMRNAVQSLSITASPQILFIDMSESGDPLNDINSLAEVCEPGTVVIAAGQVNDVRLYRDLLASGIQDYLLKPFGADQLRDALAQAQAVFFAPRDAGPERPHMTTAVIGTRGGVGASSLATSLAWLLSDKRQRPTALLDLDVHFGTNALAMDLEPGRGLTDAIENPSRIDGLFIERAMVRASDTLAILSAEAPISQPLLTDGGAFYQLLEEFRAAFECSVIDLPRAMLIQHPHLMSDVNVTVVVTELTLAAARDSIRILSWLKTNAPQSRVLVVANRVHPGAPEISRKDFEQSIERKVDVLIPFDLKVASQAAKLGKTLAETAKGSKVGAACNTLLDAVLGAAEEAEADEGRATSSKKGDSLLGKISDLKSMIPSRRKGKASA